MLKNCLICNKEFVTKKSHFNRRRCCSIKCSTLDRLGRTPWNKNKKGVQVAWNKGKTGVYSIESRLRMGAKLKGRHRSINTEFKKGENVGSKHRSWKGDKAEYTSIHSWVSRWKGRPKKCEKCGTTDKKRYEWANISGEYKRDLNDYIRLCKSCHTKLDINRSIDREVDRRLKEMGLL